jgi:Mg-chelatase subunit ChlD
MKKIHAAGFVLMLSGILLLPYAITAYELSFVKIDALKIAANGSVDITTGKGYKVGLVAFSGGDSHCPHGICSDSTLTTNASALHAQINSYQPMSGTCISCGINKSKQLLAAASGQKYIVVLSDGIPNDCVSTDGGACTESKGKQESLQQAAYALSEGMKVYAVALGDNADDAFLRNLSMTGGGKFYNVSCTSTLEQIYRNISENEAKDNLVLVSDVSGSMSTDLSYNCTTTTTSTSTSTTVSTSTTTLPACSYTPDTALTAGANSIDFQTPHNYLSNMNCSSGIYSCPAGYYSRIYAKYDTETYYDHFYIYDSITQNSMVSYGNSSGFVWLNPENVSSVRFRFSSDSSVNRWGVDVDTIECYRSNTTTSSTTTTTTPSTTTSSTTSSTTTTISTTTTSSTMSTSTTSSSTTTTTMEGPCHMPGNNPPCSEVTLEEVITAISQWAAGNMELGSVIDLIVAWSGGSTPN